MLKTLQKVVLVAACAGPLLGISWAWAEGCYTCGSGSSEPCKQYCRYPKEDSFAARKDCEKRGCKITGTGTCPAEADRKVCVAPDAKGNPAFAAIPWCAAQTRS